jgi:hypothetical protein
MAFFFSVFINNSQTASIVGYTLSIWASTIASSLNVTVYANPKEMEWFLYPFPTFPFCRVMYQIAMDCAFQKCFKSVWAMDEESKRCIIALYVEAVVYLVLALYLYYVIP